MEVFCKNMTPNRQSVFYCSMNQVIFVLQILGQTSFLGNIFG